MTLHPVPVHLPGVASPTHRGLLLRQYRLQRDYSVEGLATALDVEPRYIRLIERGERQPRDIGFWQRAARILRIPWRDILGAEGGDDAPPDGGSRLLHAADEEDALAACWALFYRSGVPAATPLVLSAIRRITPLADREVAARILLSRYTQLAGVLSRDQGDSVAARRYGQQAIRLARQTDAADVLAAALMRLARTEQPLGGMDAAIALSREAALLAPRCGTALRGYLTQHLVDMLSREGAEPHYALAQRMDRARQVAGSASSSEPDGSFVTLSDAGIAHDWAMVLIRRGAPLAECIHALDLARRALPADHHRWRIGIACSEALAYAVAGEIDSAVVLAEAVVPAARLSQSHLRRLQAAQGVCRAAAPADPGVTRLGQQLGAG